MPLSAQVPCAHQLNRHGELTHLLSTEGLPREVLQHLMAVAAQFASSFGAGREVKKVPLLRGRSVFNLFFENSTRTRTTFEIAANRLSADVYNLDIERSSTSKGETLLDTIANLEAMGADIFVVRHGDNGAPHHVAQHVGSHVHVVNAGDGNNAHPTQALLDMVTISAHKKQFQGLSVAIVGDILHSRVARSDIFALQTLGCTDIRVVGPAALVPHEFAQLGVKVCHDLQQGIAGADVVIMLRIQKERFSGTELQALAAGDAYHAAWGLTEHSLRWAAADALVMHPGPINRGVEIASDVADGPQSAILQQVTYGIAVRMAVMSVVAGASATSGA